MERIGELGKTSAVTVVTSRLLVTTDVVLTFRILFTLKTEVTRFSEMSVLTRLARRHIPEDGIRRSDSRE
jgi:hypothetical protein